MGIGADDRRGVNVARARATGAEGGRYEVRAQALAARDDEVAGPRTQIAEQSEPGGERRQLVELSGYEREQRRPRSAGGDDGARRAGVFRAQCRDQVGDPSRFTPDGRPRHREQGIRRPRHGGDHHDGRLGAVATDDSYSLTDRGGVGQGGPAELVNVRGRLR